MIECKEGVLDCDGVPLRYAESGKGRAVVVLPAESGVVFDDIATALATDHRVIVFDVSASLGGNMQEFAEHFSQALARLGVASFSLVGISPGATLALAQAVYAPGQIDRLILLSPLLAIMQYTELGAKLRRVKAPTLVLVGTRDRSGSREAGRFCREHIPTCHLLLVYEAGHAIAADRREACLSPTREFLEQGEGFIVSHESQLIRP